VRRVKGSIPASPTPWGTLAADEKSSEAEDQRRTLVLVVAAPLELREPKSREATLMPVAAFDPLAGDTLFLGFGSPALPG
jgi:hypothetical protein